MCYVMKNSSSNARRIKCSVEFDFLLICYIRTILRPVLTYKGSVQNRMRRNLSKRQHYPQLENMLFSRATSDTSEFPQKESRPIRKATTSLFHCKCFCPCSVSSGLLLCIYSSSAQHPMNHELLQNLESSQGRK